MSSFHFSNSDSGSESYRLRVNGIHAARANATVFGNDAAEMALPAEIAGAAPLQLTGCVSELSCCLQNNTQYDEALKAYAKVYSDYQKYLHVDDQLRLPTSPVAITEEHILLGLIGDDIEQSIRRYVHFSDEEIEQCGYLGWLQH
jgi:hypothetical protein